MEQNRRSDLGRSGPRRKTGCFTCRRRKVRCDETKPACGHCMRLKLQCHYKKDISVSRNGATATSINPVPISPVTTIGSHSPEPGALSNNALSGENSTIRLDASFSGPPYERDSRRSSAIDVYHFITGAGAQHPEKQQQLNNVHFANADPRSLLVAPANDLNDGRRASAAISDPSVSIGGNAVYASSSPSLTHASTAAFEQPGDIPPALEPAYDEQLIQYFLEARPPAAIFAPLDIEWDFMKPALVELARDSNPLMNALYCYAGAHRARQEKSSWHWTLPYYKAAMTGLQTYLTDDISHGALKNVFASIFLLMLTEVLSENDLMETHNISHLRSAHILLSKYHTKIKRWRGFGRLLISWIILLDVKAIIAGRDGDLLVEPFGASKPAHTSSSDLPSDESEVYENAVEDPLSSNPSFLLYNSITGPVLDFYIESQKINRRIVQIDLHHRARGTLGDEYEVLQIAHKISADLEALWHSRPSVLDIYDRPGELHDMLPPKVSRHICRVFRVYVANFLAQFIYLHRVAFSIYPRTERVTGAVDKIIGLAGMELDVVKCLPPSFLWPIFLAGLEASTTQRDWFEGEMRRMEKEGNDEIHPNIRKTILLFEELERRQNVLKASADSRCVRRELFTDFFVVI